MLPALAALVSGCAILAPFPSKLAVQQLEHAKGLDARSPGYDALVDAPVDCPAAPRAERQRTLVCAQLWTYRASACLKAYGERTAALAGRPVLTAEERRMPAAALECALAASASAVRFLPATAADEDGVVLPVYTVRARAVERRRENRGDRDSAPDDAEIGALAAQMTALPQGAAYASYFLAGTAAHNAATAGAAARTAPEDARPAARATACATAQGGLQVLPRTVAVPALAAPLATRRTILTRLSQEFCS